MPRMLAGQIIAFAALVIVATDPEPPWTLAWSDEFDSASDLDANWRFDNFSTCGDLSMVAGTVQTWDTTSASVNASKLQIRPSIANCRDVRIPVGVPGVPDNQRQTRQCEFLSARLRSKAGFFSRPRGGASFDAVRVEASILVPGGSFVSPSLWMLPSIEGLPWWVESCQWPTAGEIDVLAWSPSDSSTTSAFHFGPPGQCIPGHGTCRIDGTPRSLATDAFHTFAVEYSATAIRFEVDGAVALEVNHTQDIGPAPYAQWPVFRSLMDGSFASESPFSILLALRLLQGDGEEAVASSGAMLVDNVRVWLRSTQAGPDVSFSGGCARPGADNYDASAAWDDGSCVWTNPPAPPSLPSPPSPPPTSPPPLERSFNRVTVLGMQLLLDGRPFAMRAICYSPVPFGDDPGWSEPFGDYFTTQFEPIFARDFALMRRMGVNTLRLYTWKRSRRHTEFLDAAHQHDLVVIGAFEMGYAHDTPLVTSTEMFRAENRLRTQISGAVHPAVIMWFIGNEINGPWLHYICTQEYADGFLTHTPTYKRFGRCMFGSDALELGRRVNRLCQVVHSEGLLCTTAFAAVDPPDRFVGWDPYLCGTCCERELPCCAHCPARYGALGWINTWDPVVPDLDIWGVNLYTGRNVTGFQWDLYAASTGRPMFISETGLDAFDSLAPQMNNLAVADGGDRSIWDWDLDRFGSSSPYAPAGQFPFGAPNQETQGLWIQSLIESSERHLSNCAGAQCDARAYSVGISIMAWVDEYWKGRVAHSIDDSPLVQFMATIGECPSKSPKVHSLCGYANPGQFDHFVNEEWFGLFAVQQPCEVADRIRPRDAVFRLQMLWGMGSCLPLYPENGTHMSYDSGNFPSCGMAMRLLRRAYESVVDQPNGYLHQAAIVFECDYQQAVYNQTVGQSGFVNLTSFGLLPSFTHPVEYNTSDIVLVRGPGGAVCPPAPNYTFGHGEPEVHNLRVQWNESYPQGFPLSCPQANTRDPGFLIAMAFLGVFVFLAVAYFCGPTIRLARLLWYATFPNAAAKARAARPKLSKRQAALLAGMAPDAAHAGTVAMPLPAASLVARALVPPSAGTREQAIDARVEPIAEHLCAIFGFQTSSAPNEAVGSNGSNQAHHVAHLLLNLMSQLEAGTEAHGSTAAATLWAAAAAAESSQVSPPPSPPPSAGPESFEVLFARAVDELYDQAMTNFFAWLRHTKMDAHWHGLPGPRTGTQRPLEGGAEDESSTLATKLHLLLLYQLILGEASNLRMLPEFCCFVLFLQATCLQPSAGSSRSPSGGGSPAPPPLPLLPAHPEAGLEALVQPEDFLHSVVTPMYHVLRHHVQQLATKPVSERVMYDDLNELFWSAAKLQHLLPASGQPMAAAYSHFVRLLPSLTHLEVEQRPGSSARSANRGSRLMCCVPSCLRKKPEPADGLVPTMDEVEPLAVANVEAHVPDEPAAPAGSPPPSPPDKQPPASEDAATHADVKRLIAKTYIEAPSVVHALFIFHRYFAFNSVIMHLIICYVFEDGLNLSSMLTCVVTDASWKACAALFKLRVKSRAGCGLYYPTRLFATFVAYLVVVLLFVFDSLQKGPGSGGFFDFVAMGYAGITIVLGARGLCAPIERLLPRRAYLRSSALPATQVLAYVGFWLLVLVLKLGFMYFVVEGLREPTNKLWDGGKSQLNNGSTPMPSGLYCWDLDRLGTALGGQSTACALDNLPGTYIKSDPSAPLGYTVSTPEALYYYRKFREWLYRLTLLALRWVVPVLLMFADIMLWQTLVASFISCFIGVRRRLFVVQGWVDLINKLPSIVPLANEKLVSSAQVEHLGGRLTPEQEHVLAYRAHERALDGEGPGYEGTSLGYQCFARQWNAIVTDLHQSDRISQQEHDELAFGAIRSESLGVFAPSPSDGERSSMEAAREKPPSLPVCEFTILPTMILSTAFVPELWGSNPTGRYSLLAPALVQARELSCWLLTALGFVPAGASAEVRKCLTQLAVANCRTPAVRTALVLVGHTLREYHRGCCEATATGAALSDSYASELQEAVKSLLGVLDHELRATSVPPSQRLKQRRDSALDVTSSSAEEGSAQPATASGAAAEAMVALQRLRNLLDETAIGKKTSDAAQPITSTDTSAAILSLANALCTTNPGGEPKGQEAVRQLVSFANSMFHRQMGASPPPVRCMRSLSALTPYYKEDVSKVLARLQQIDTQDENASTLQTLVALFPDEWVNMLERTDISATPGMMVGPLAQLAQGSSAGDVYARKQIALWAADREQTLSRTVRGVMRIGNALRLTARLEGVPEEEVESLVASKFEYVVSAQVYHALKLREVEEHAQARDDAAKASAIDELMEAFPHNLKVAYIKEEPDGTFHSVLMRARPAHRGGGTEVLYKVKLPGNPIVGEGKPENQNHAIIFARGQCLQTLDMNQDGYLGEAFKMRNLLEGFVGNVRLIGFREHIFSLEVGTVGAFAASNEFVFGTMTQRFLNYPLAVRFHYGHPDVWDKVWVQANGGVAKASKTLHISEDIFGGINILLRGQDVSFVEFVQAGKGRDVTFSATNGFESKIAGGNAMQLLSRDYYRLVGGADFFRMLSLFTTGPGAFFCNALLTWSLYWFPFALTILAATDRELYFVDGLAFDYDTVSGDEQIYNGFFVIQLGLLTIVPLVIAQWFERGGHAAISEFFLQTLCLKPIFMLFQSRTSMYHLVRGLRLGSASYVATGRSLDSSRSNFTTLFGQYCRSHFCLATEMFLVTLLYRIVTHHPGYAIGATWAIFVYVGGQLVSPWLFTPNALRGVSFYEELIEFLSWLDDASDIKVAEGSWTAWHRKHMAMLRSKPMLQRWSLLAGQELLPRLILFMCCLAAIIRDDFEPPPPGQRFGNLANPNLREIMLLQVTLWFMLVSTIFWALTDHHFMQRSYLFLEPDQGSAGWYLQFHSALLKHGRILIAVYKWTARSVAMYAYISVAFWTMAPYLGPKGMSSDVFHVQVITDNGQAEPYFKNAFCFVVAGLLFQSSLAQMLALLQPPADSDRGSVRKMVLIYSDFWFREIDDIIGSTLLVILFVLSLLPIASFQASLLFNHAQADNLRTIKERAYLLKNLVVTLHPRHLWKELQRALRSCAGALARCFRCFSCLAESPDVPVIDKAVDLDAMWNASPALHQSPASDAASDRAPYDGTTMRSDLEAIATHLSSLFGFQTKHLDDSTGDEVPSSRALAVDNLAALLASMMSRHEVSRYEADNYPSTERHETTPKSSARALAPYRAAIALLHKTQLSSYAKWMQHTRFESALEEADDAVMSLGALSVQGWDSVGNMFRFSSEEEEDRWLCHAQLHQLVLWQLLYVEAANLRMMPELLCFIFHCAANAVRLPEVKLADALSIEEYMLPGTHLPYPEQDYLSRIVTPVYDFLKAEMQVVVNMSSSLTRGAIDRTGLSSAIVYDDINESCWFRDRLNTLVPAEVATSAAYHCLRERLAPASSGANAHDHATSAELPLSTRGEMAKEGGGDLPTQPGISRDDLPSSRAQTDAQDDASPSMRASFAKIYRETVSWASLFKVYYRVFMMHVLTLHLLFLLALRTASPPIPLTTLSLAGLAVSHAVCKMLRQVTNMLIVDPPFNAGERTDEKHQRRSRRTAVILLCCYALIPILFALDLSISSALDHADDYYNDDSPNVNATTSSTFIVYSTKAETFQLIALVYVCVNVLMHFVLTRPGLVLRAPFRSDRSPFMGHPRDLHVPWSSFCFYAVFWYLTWALKLVFGYYLLVTPLVNSIEAFSSPEDYCWSGQSWRNVHQFCPIVLRGAVNAACQDNDRTMMDEVQGLEHFCYNLAWVRAQSVLFMVFRVVVPIFVYFLDLFIFYSLMSSLCSTLVALHMRIGRIASWSDLLRDFEETVMRFHVAMVNKDGVTDTPFGGNGCRFACASPSDRWATVKKIAYDSFSPEATSLPWQCFAHAWNALCKSLRRRDLLSDDELRELLFYFLDGPREVQLFGAPEFVIFPAILTSPVLSRPGSIGMDRTRAAYPSFTRALLQMRDLTVYLAVQLNVVDVEDTRELLQALTELGKRVHVLRERSRSFKVASMVHLRMSLANALLALLEMCKAVSSVEAAEERTWQARESLPAFQTLLAEVLSAVKGLLAGEAGSFSRGTVETYRQLLRLVHLDRLQEEGVAERTAQALAKPHLAMVIDTLLLSLTSANPGGQPRNAEARRQILFFCSSLYNPHLKRPPSMSCMRSLTVLTPHYAEEVDYSMTALAQELDGNLNLLALLQSMFPDEWKNFAERQGVTGVCDASKLHEAALVEWCSDRGQLLSRTVRGVMQTAEGMRVLAKLEGMSKQDAERLIQSKFEYVLACQKYSAFLTDEQDNPVSQYKAAAITRLMEAFPESVRTACIQEDKPRGTFYSALMRGRPADRGGGTKVLYKVKLPGNPIVGEGKPENQNHAIIFARGQCLQTLDMNQDGYLGEAFKMRNLLEGFVGNVRLIGFREHIFSQSGGAVAALAASSEFVFGTMSQRFMSYPLHVRFHYGHPDVWDRVWAQANGGVAKATKTLHVSEDIFGGVNVFLRGGDIKYTEFINCGKGRDLSFIAVNAFEQKVSSGNAMQLLSRDMLRFSKGLDIYRLHSFFYSGHAYFLTNFLVTAATRWLIIVQILFLLAGVEYYTQVAWSTDANADAIRAAVQSAGSRRQLSEDQTPWTAHQATGANQVDRPLPASHMQCGGSLLFSCSSDASHYYLPPFDAERLSVSPAVPPPLTLERARRSLLDPGNIPTAPRGSGPPPFVMPTNGTSSPLSDFQNAYPIAQWQSGTYSSIFILQIGAVLTIPLFLVLWLEQSFWSAVSELVVSLSFGMIFHLFSIRTRGYHFARGLSLGRSKYVATGRGYDFTKHSLVQLYTLYASSHTYLGAELLVLLIVYAIYQTNTTYYWLSTWALWIFMASVMLSPWLFSPDGWSMSDIAISLQGWLEWLNDASTPSTGMGGWQQWHDSRMAETRAMTAWKKLSHFAATLPLRLILSFASLCALELNVAGTPLLRTTLDSMTDFGRKAAVVVASFGTTLVFSILMHQVSRLAGLCTPSFRNDRPQRFRKCASCYLTLCVVVTICAYPFVVDFVAEQVVTTLLLDCDSEGVFCVDGEVPKLIKILEIPRNSIAVLFVNLNLFAIVIEVLSLRDLTSRRKAGACQLWPCRARAETVEVGKPPQSSRSDPYQSGRRDAPASAASGPSPPPPASVPPSPPSPRLPEADFEEADFEDVENESVPRSARLGRASMARISIAEAQSIMQTVQEEHRMSSAAPTAPMGDAALKSTPSKGCVGQLSCGLRFDDFYLKILDTMIGVLILSFVLLFTVLPTKFFQSVLLYNRSFAQLLSDVGKRRSLIHRLLLD